VQRASRFVGPLPIDFCDINVLLPISMDIKLSLAINNYPRSLITNTPPMWFGCNHTAA
jgi:hypothetical protein